MVDENCYGADSIKSKIDAPMLTTPHSVSMVDFDGDCMADLFITIEDENDPSKKHYELYLRQERKMNSEAISKEL